MINLYTEKTKIINLKNRIEINKENAKKINTTLFELRAYPNWYYENGIYYYYKECRNNIEILNHFICEKIAEKFNVLTANYIPAKDNYCSGLATPNFRKQGINYQISQKEYFFVKNASIVFNNLEISFINADDLINDLLKLIAFHIYTGLIDIHPYNILFIKDGNKLNLAPAFDYDYAFQSSDELKKFSYLSAICGFDIPSKDFEEILNKYPYFKDYLNLFLTINMNELLNEITEEYNLYINELYSDHYKKQDEIKKEFIRKLHL